MQRICFKRSPIHGFGAFATADLPEKTHVIEYVGVRIRKSESIHQCRLNNEFIFYLDDEFDLDGNVAWNPARWINHSCSPNCEAELIDGRIWIISNRLVRQSEEITFNYGYELTDLKDHPCRCGSIECVGYVVAEEFHERLRNSSEGGTPLRAVKSPS
jgi:SET domain-containing protein